MPLHRDVLVIALAFVIAAALYLVSFPELITPQVGHL